MPADLPGLADAERRAMDVRIPTAGPAPVVARDDPYSDRLRCDHPDARDGAALGRALLEAAVGHGRRRVVVLARRGLAPGLQEAGYWLEGVIPGYYRGAEDCCVLGGAPGGKPAPASPAMEAEVDALAQRYPKWVSPPGVLTERARPRDATAVAAMVAPRLRFYPTPIGNAAYLERRLATPAPFRVVREEGAVAACAGADLDPAARAAELTDCFTAPSHRRRGLMRALLADLMRDLAGQGYLTAFTLCRATSPGINLAFKGLGFTFRGRMIRSCRIGEGIEDMNVWSRGIPGPTAPMAGA
ncbi:MAG: GNAT family N-acetyltransferase [Pseudomonadota bacterium]